MATLNTPDKATEPEMPPVWAGRRRGQLVMLGTLGVLEAVVAVMMSLTVNSVLDVNVASNGWDIAALFAAVAGIGIARWIQKVLAEEVGQDYVKEQRRRLLAVAIADSGYSTSLGVTVTRTSNDLNALRNWISQGIVPLVTGLPLIIVVVLVLIVMNWKIGLAVATPLAAIAALMPFLAHVTLERARNVRRQRGRMSARIADTVMASESVRASGAVQREVNAIDRASGKLAQASIDQAWISGIVRALTGTAASLATVFVVIEAFSGVISPSDVASTMMLLGVLSVPVADMGRVVEYRQNYKAASRILAPVLEAADGLEAREAKRRKAWREEQAGQLRIDHSLPRGIRIEGPVIEGHPVPELVARPGEKIRIVAEDPHRVRVLIATLTSLSEPGIMTVDGHDAGVAPGQVRRELMGVASEHVPLERGSVKRLVKYRMPSASNKEVRELLDDVGLTALIEQDKRGWNLQLKNDGQPWSLSNVMLLKVARALLGTPPLLILEGVENVVDAEAAQHLREALQEYDGVVLFTSATPQGQYREWHIDG